MPTAHYDMNIADDPDLLAQLVQLGCLNPKLTLKKAANHAVGHSRESLAAILEYALSRGVLSPTVLRHGTLVHEPTMIYPWGGGAINNRLTNPDLALSKPHDGWPSVCGIWQSLKNQQDTPALPSGKRPPQPSTLNHQPSHGLDRSPEETARLIALTAAREARYGSQVDVLNPEECKSLLSGNAIYLAALARWNGTGPKPSTLRGALKLALEAREKEG